MDDVWDIFSTATHFSGMKEKETSRIGSKSAPHCSECGSEDLVLDHGHQLCVSCGTDLGPVLEGDDGSIFHDTDKTGNTHRLSGNVNSLLQKSSLGTSIGGGSYKFRSMVRYHKYNSMPYKERS
jgi:transcription initiation factor TFIIIB Brf1 subunit/transcription initiation factor TFIIB